MSRLQTHARDAHGRESSEGELRDGGDHRGVGGEQAKLSSTQLSPELKRPLTLFQLCLRTDHSCLLPAKCMAWSA